ncbi:transmembrane protein, putative, partial [Bodo saltans]
MTGTMPAPGSPAALLDRSSRTTGGFSSSANVALGLYGNGSLALGGGGSSSDYHRLPTPCTADEIRLLSPLAALKDHFDSLRCQHERGESLMNNRIQAQTVILRASVAMSFHHIDSLLLNAQLVVVDNALLRDALTRASEMWHRDDTEHLDALSDVIHELDTIMKARVSLSISSPVVRLSRLSGLWLMLVSRETHFSSRILTLGIFAIIQIALLIINVATGDEPQLILSVVLFVTCIATYVFLAL